MTQSEFDFGFDLLEIKEHLLEECENLPQWRESESAIKEYLKKEKIGKLYLEKLGYNPLKHRR